MRAQDVNSYLANARTNIISNFSIRQSNGQQSAYVPETYVASFNNNKADIFGYDAYSNPALKKAMLLSLKLNEPVMTGNVFLERSNSQHSSFVIFLPVFNQNLPLKSLQQRQSALVGFMSISIDLETM